MDKSKDFRGIWRTRSGHFAKIIKPKVSSVGKILAWIGELYDNNGKNGIIQAWDSQGNGVICERDLIEKKRGTEYSGNDFEWPILKEG